MNRALVLLEISTAVATLISAVFVGWQAMLLRAALDSPYLANLQDRQIDACAEYSKAFGVFESAHTTKYGAGASAALPEGITTRWDDPTYFSLVDQNVLPLLAAIEAMIFFGDEEVDRLTGEMREIVSDVRLSAVKATIILREAQTGIEDSGMWSIAELNEEEARRFSGLSDFVSDAMFRARVLHASISDECSRMLSGESFLGQ